MYVGNMEIQSTYFVDVCMCVVKAMWLFGYLQHWLNPIKAAGRCNSIFPYGYTTLPTCSYMLYVRIEPFMTLLYGHKSIKERRMSDVSLLA